MKRIAFFLFTIVFSVFALAESNDFKFVYHGLNFYIPEAPKSAGFLGTENDTIVIKYGDNPGENLIGFSAENEMKTGGCEPEDFFKETLGEIKAGCDELAVGTFRRVFVDDRDTGVWSGEKYNFYYFIGDKKTTIFFASGEPSTKILKVDSNFLTKNLMKRVFKEYLH
jgi:hypothetical protein